MIVAVAVVLVVKMTVYQIVNVVTVRYRLVPTAWSVHMVSVVPIAGMPRRTVFRVGI